MEGTVGARLVVIGLVLATAGGLHLTGNSTPMVFVGIAAVVVGAILWGVKRLGGNR
jgi:hypothetical protein